ncbi:MAG TPA: hypothetical protein VMT37_04815 [Solirubrobacterales bacterium]|nr:hypothetical protein [Solirubrobacterales bacterium]
MPRRPNSGRPPAPTRAAAIVFALLVLATVGAFAYAQRVKRDPLVLDKVTFVAVPRQSAKEAKKNVFTPNGDCRKDKMRIRFRTTVSDQGTVQIIKPGGRLILTLARDQFLKRYHFHTFFWGGQRRGGGNAAAGRYKLRVKLLGEGRTLVPPGSIKLHRSPPHTTTSCTTVARSGGVSPNKPTGSAP